jgi:hypothetical protein
MLVDLAVALLCSASVACGGRGDPSIRVIDLVRDLPRAEKRPDASAFEVAEHTVSAVRHASIAAAVPSRMIFTTQFPAHGLLRMDLAVMAGPGTGDDGAVGFRIGVSDGRLYESLANRTVTVADTNRNGWTPLAVDVSLYGGRQWSLFYRPDAHAWQLIFNADQRAGTTRALWGAPGVDTDQRSAEAWWRRGRR